MRRIREERKIALPHMPEVVSIVTEADSEGKRILFINVCAAKDAKIIRIMPGISK